MFTYAQTSDTPSHTIREEQVPIVNKSLFSSVELTAPKLPEQKRNANFLSSLDETILAESQKLETLKTHKKGLMRQLFPLLSGAGSVNHARMEQRLEPLYLDFGQRRKMEEARAVDAQDEAELKALENTIKNRPRP